MSKCIAYININGKRLEVSLPNSDPSVIIDDSIIEGLKNNPDALNTLVDNLRIVGNKSEYTPIKLEDVKKDGILANCTASYIRSLPEYANIPFPDVNANILLVNSLKIGNVPMYGRVVDAQGKEIIIVKNTETDIRKLARYLSLKNAIQEGQVISTESQYYPKLEELYNKKKRKKVINKVEDVILDYLQNKQDYKSLVFKDGSSVLQFMEKLTRTLQKYNTLKEYNSPIITELNFRKKWLGHNAIMIDYSELYQVVQMYLPDILNALKINNVNDFIEMVKISDGKMSEVLKQLDGNYNSNENSNLKSLYTYISQTEPDFDYTIIKVNKNNFILKSEAQPISDRYSIAYETIANMTSEEYKGYTIYSYDSDSGPMFFISRGSLLETSKRKPFQSLKEAKFHIDESIKEQILNRNSFIEFMFRDSYTDEKGNKQYVYEDNENITSKSYVNVGQVFGVLDLAIDKDTIISGREAYLLNGKTTLIDFYNTVDTYNIQEEDKQIIRDLINTPQKAVAFLYKLNEYLGTADRSSKDKILKIANQISSAPLKYYYVEKAEKSGNSIEYTLVKTEPNELQEYKANNQYPTTQWFNAIATSLKNEFGLETTLLTATEINEDFKGIANANTDKAFIYNGNIYINTSIASSTDLLHEYTHLILGVLKTIPNLRQNYEELIRGVYVTNEGQTEANNIKESYPNLSEMDVAEEVFCNLFSGYIRKTINRNTQEVFKASESDLKRYTSNIFNTKIESFEDFYSKSLESVFGKFKKEIGVMLQNENIDFGSTKKARQISNWISKKISEGEIKEQC